jgi:hypothetical protein
MNNTLIELFYFQRIVPIQILKHGINFFATILLISEGRFFFF